MSIKERDMDIVLTPLPNGANLLHALEMLVQHAPLSDFFARAVLNAFGKPPVDGKQAQLRALLSVWDMRIPALQDEQLPSYISIIDAARKACA
jgi:hypothetical protein